MPLRKPLSKKRGSVYPVLLHKADTTKKTAYVNITILDASDAIYNMVHSKVNETHKNWVGPQKFKDMVAHNVAKTASTKVPKRVLVQKLSDKIPKMLMYKMYHNAGMRLAAQTVFREDKYAVLQIQVQWVDTKRLLENAKEDVRNSGTEEDKKEEEEDDDSVATAVLDEWIEEQKNLLQEEQESSFVTEAQNLEPEGEKIDFSNWREVLVMILAWILTKIMPVTITKDLEENKLPALIQSQISKNMKEMLDKKLASKNLRAETAVLPEEEQARYFFANLQKIRTDPAAKEGTMKLDPVSP